MWKGTSSLSSRSLTATTVTAGNPDLHPTITEAQAGPCSQPLRSLGSVVKLLTPSEDYTDEYNAWLESFPNYIYPIVFIIKRFAPHETLGRLAGHVWCGQHQRLSLAMSSRPLGGSLSARTFGSVCFPPKAGGPSSCARILSPRQRFRPGMTSLRPWSCRPRGLGVMPPGPVVLELQVRGQL